MDQHKVIIQSNFFDNIIHDMKQMQSEIQYLKKIIENKPVSQVQSRKEYENYKDLKIQEQQKMIEKLHNDLASAKVFIQDLGSELSALREYKRLNQTKTPQVTY